MATEKNDLVAEEAEDKKTETTGPEEAKSQPDQKVSEPVQEKPAEEVSETTPEKKPEVTDSKEVVEKPENETKKPESPETDSDESEPVESTKQDYFAGTRNDLPDLKPGDIIRVYYRVIEGGKERIQAYEGTVIAMKNSGISKTITVRKTSFGIAVERIFPLSSKLIQKIEVKKHSKVRRAKLYYLRKLKGKAARLKELR